MKFKKIKYMVWELLTDEGFLFYGTSKKDCLNQLAKHKGDK